MIEIPAEQALQMVRRLRQPAGDDPRFTSAKSLHEHYSAFLKAFHEGLAGVHQDVIAALLARERELEMDAHRIAEDDLIHFFRRSSDTLVWVGLGGRRHQVKALCDWDRSRRPVLSRANSESVRSWVRANIDTAKEFAVWTDTTSFVGTGDILVFRPGGEYRIVELKQIGDATHAVTTSTDEGQIKDLRKRAHVELGQSQGDRMVDRLLRQQGKMTAAEELIESEHGTHPFTGLKYAMFDNDVPEHHYGKEIDGLVKTALDGESATQLVDECLWVAAYPRNRIIFEAFIGSACAVFENPTTAKDYQSFVERKGPSIFSSLATQRYPIVKPCPLLPIKEETAAALMSGHVVLLSYLHWDWFGEVAKERFGLGFTWTDAKLAEAENREKFGKDHNRVRSARPLVTDQGIPTIESSFSSIQIGPPVLFRMLGDFVRPTTIMAEHSQVPTADDIERLRQQF